MTQTPTMPVQQGLTPLNTQAQPVYEITEIDKKRQEAIGNALKAYKGEFEPPLRRRCLTRLTIM
jgi:hypothetical protein